MLIVLPAGTAFAQDSDTLFIAKTLRDQTKLKKSMELLEAYHKTHPNDLYTNWIYAQVAYQARRFRLSVDLFNHAVTLSPNDNVLRLDYAKCLVNTGNFMKADAELKRLTSIDISNPEPWYYLAKIEYWKGEHKNALALLENLLLNIPEYVPAQLLRDQIQKDLSLWLSLDFSYASDDQPMKILTTALRGGWYRSNHMGLDFQFNKPLVLRDSGNFSALGFSIGNKFHFSRANVTIYLNLGLFRHTSQNSTGWTGDLKIEKGLLRKLSVWAEIQRKPYISTLTSLQLPLFENHLTFAASLNDPDHWNGRLSYEGSTFSSDKNYITAICGWIFVPAMKTGRFDFHLGYGYNYSTAKESRFASEKTLSDILVNWDLNVPVTGIYNPYFTPKDQQVHSLLTTINFRVSRTLIFSVNVNGGVFATTRYPYLYLDKDASDSVMIMSSFIYKTFFPVTVNAGMNWDISKTLEMLLQFNYNSTIYYSMHTTGITIRKRF
ncbi:MAG: hypothetical protein Q8M08_08725 [Bacteroidales bacterium]|nr:hypothetical protein [Bacteroidales bacterium]